MNKNEETNFRLIRLQLLSNLNSTVLNKYLNLGILCGHVYFDLNKSND